MAGVYTPGEPNITTFTGLEQIPLDTLLPSGQTPQTGYITTAQLGLGGSLTAYSGAVVAAGSTQGGATVLTSKKNIITVATTASTHGVQLPTASTGLEIIVGNAATFGAKVYPATNGKIGAASTNAADSTVLAINKSNTYRAVNKTLWIVERGA